MSTKTLVNPFSHLKKGQKIVIVCRVYSDEPLFDLDCQEKELVEAAKLKGLVILGVVRHADPRPGYPNGIHEEKYYEI